MITTSPPTPLGKYFEGRGRSLITVAHHELLDEDVIEQEALNGLSCPKRSGHLCPQPVIPPLQDSTGLAQTWV
jgi:hypothetical protein